MAPYVFVLAWVAQGTVLGLGLLLVPRLLRVRHPERLTWWWGSGAFAVVAMPLMPLLAPVPPPSPPAAMTAFVDATTVALAPALPTGWAPPPLAVLALLWGLGVAVRLAWLATGQMRLARLADAAAAVVDDPALDRARRLLPARGRRHPLAYLPVPVVASEAGVPCAFGWTSVRVLVPRALREQPDAQRVSVYLHELLHVARGDVHRAYGDEAWRLVFWWHPAVSWMLARLRVAREHEVDAEVVSLMGGRRDYVEALVWCSTQRPTLSFGPHAGGRRHVLVRRIALICTDGGDMSRTRRWITNGGLVMTAAAMATGLGLLMPLRAASSTQDERRELSGPGPLERVAALPTLDAPVPRRVVAVEPVWSGADGHRFRVHLVLDAAGRVAEARAVGHYSGESPPTTPSDIATAEAAALDAVRQWQFDSPVASPLLVATDVTVGRVNPVPSASPSSRPPLRIGGGVMPPTKLVDVKPAYPEAAKTAGVSGVVILEATIDTTGAVQDARVLRSIPLLDAAALDAVRQWRYTPTWLNGEAVPVTMTMTINFTLQ